ncbi:(R,R)-butanediol dehydrogenase [Fulvia fulva]|uniref:(R,R)-butanediol dehydrogenase n=1 Tax=Passalora fulva TaxID=5499 RepID=A0A9Q8LC44_PASFU|nr:(R,R)-butanediol dehydrogenase [Fulvia fulva]KAK4631772.1 (R,R)-butanediol dehydrogenase [Fulvia fulva]KAK4632521.1 (R,R)-butanediol dehydrogenase [Fulvia fulva]UJO14514.1 (R,R)-butanediol dehydrogenase [Fulvia fulva]WPV12023.1 (R,R)-butanediol dehydrogenase [Fulvia fulva]WPV25846.1 (R,R)-butanediol dehydrogenase [Fulvia fulva]
MKAARFHARGDIRVDEVEEPQPSDGQVIVDVEWCGICGSDLHEYLVGPITVPTTERPHPLSKATIPVTLGHELCGKVRSPPAGSKFKHGDNVMVDPRVLCNACLACKAGISHCCSKLGYIGGSTGFGGFGETVVVDEGKLYLLPPQIPLEYAAVLEPLVIVHHAMKVSRITDWRDKDVLVLGGGPIGFALLLCLKAAGAKNVIVSEPTALRREQVSHFCHTVINPSEENVPQRCSELTDDRGVEVVFDCAGAPRALPGALDALQFEGLYMMVAVWEQDITIPCWQFLAKHITMKGTLIFDDRAMSEVIQMIVDGKLQGYKKMVTGRIRLDDIIENGFKELINNKDEHIKILVSPKSI